MSPKKFTNKVIVDQQLKVTECVNGYYVASSNVEWVGWPANGRPLLLVKYKHGGLYGYLGVPRQRAVALAHAPSVGRYIHNQIKGHYKPVQIREP